jgi:hypothetical protein
MPGGDSGDGAAGSAGATSQFDGGPADDSDAGDSASPDGGVDASEDTIVKQPVMIFLSLCQLPFNTPIRNRNNSGSNVAISLTAIWSYS